MTGKVVMKNVKYVENIDRNSLYDSVIRSMDIFNGTLCIEPHSRSRNEDSATKMPFKEQNKINK